MILNVMILEDKEGLSNCSVVGWTKIPFMSLKNDMAGKMLVKLLLLLMLSELILVSISEAKAWWGRRRCSRSRPSPPGVEWKNNWHESFNFDCPNRQSLGEWRSVHRNCKEDRIHHFGCAYSPLPSDISCTWTAHFVNEYDKNVHFKCPHNGLITGVRSEYSGHHHDRRFGFRCCHAYGQDFKTHRCRTTPEQNNWDGDLLYTVPANYYLVGVFSVHSNSKEDRRWRFEICQFSKKK
ncbi:hypothetical protein OS493_003058 [Desmophyllum pertusum]|uniref:Hemagglutinin/amebocyte aggregation factor n=1 Tax=Desmophyllum pertusum TaxID=174260 RepID=A0A9W9YJN7_9CNID|nr:hypothetical protein OS493_003058 [Desmophyllum pertusum]